jgi:hypothetical protein
MDEGNLGLAVNSLLKLLDSASHFSTEIKISVCPPVETILTDEKIESAKELFPQYGFRVLETWQSEDTDEETGFHEISIIHKPKYGAVHVISGCQFSDGKSSITLSKYVPFFYRKPKFQIEMITKDVYSLPKSLSDFKNFTNVFFPKPDIAQIILSLESYNQIGIDLKFDTKPFKALLKYIFDDMELVGRKEYDLAFFLDHNIVALGMTAQLADLVEVKEAKDIQMYNYTIIEEERKDETLKKISEEGIYRW